MIIHKTPTFSTRTSLISLANLKIRSNLEEENREDELGMMSPRRAKGKVEMRSMKKKSPM